MATNTTNLVTTPNCEVLEHVVHLAEVLIQEVIVEVTLTEVTVEVPLPEVTMEVDN